MATKVQETKKETSKEDQEMMDYIKLSYDTIHKLYNENHNFITGFHGGWFCRCET